MRKGLLSVLPVTVLTLALLASACGGTKATTSTLPQTTTPPVTTTTAPPVTTTTAPPVTTTTAPPVTTTTAPPVTTTTPPPVTTTTAPPVTTTTTPPTTTTTTLPTSTILSGIAFVGINLDGFQPPDPTARTGIQITFTNNLEGSVELACDALEIDTTILKAGTFVYTFKIPGKYKFTTDEGAIWTLTIQ